MTENVGISKQDVKPEIKVKLEDISNGVALLPLDLFSPPCVSSFVQQNQTPKVSVAVTIQETNHCSSSSNFIPVKKISNILSDIKEENIQPPKKRLRAQIELSKGTSSVAAAPKTSSEISLDNSEIVNVTLKADHTHRPLWVTPDNHIFMETFGVHYERAQPFLVSIAEPLSRTALMHEYQLTSDSLFAAVSVGISPSAILSELSKLSKVNLHPKTITFIHEHTDTFGMVRLVLENQVHYVESKHPEVLTFLHSDSEVRQAIKRDETGEVSRITSTELQSDYGNSEQVFRFSLVSDPTASNREHFRVREMLKRRCRDLRYPLSTFYDFHSDHQNADIDLNLRPTTRLRRYQEIALSKMFTSGRSRSGLIVLPCGAGKTLVGVTATSTMKKRTLVLCLNTVSVEQWVSQFRLWSTIRDSRLTKFTADHKEMPGDVLVTTYNMVSFAQHRNPLGESIMQEIRSIEWGLTILDEVHVVPAKTFRDVIEIVHAHCIMGLTATLLREDDKIDDLKFLIGPKLYEANWLELSREGALATVACVEVHCPMTAEFYRAYLAAPAHRQTQLYIFNPFKFWCTQALIEFHEHRGDKIIVFSDSLPALRHFAFILRRPFIEGDVSQAERMSVLDHFKHNPKINTIFITKVGDTSIDLPEATVIIQISSHFGSRRQEAQRLGRILRPKSRRCGDEGHAAYFYSLVSSDTKELFYCSKRQQFLLDQGYSYKVIGANDIIDGYKRMTKCENPFEISSAADQAKLLDYVQSLKDGWLEKDAKAREQEERALHTEASRSRKASLLNMHPLLRNLFVKKR